MPKYQIDLNGQKFEIEAPDDQALSFAVKQLQQETAKGTAPSSGGGLKDTLNAFGTGVADMATFGLADEMGAAARWAGGKVLPWQSNVTYSQALDEVRGMDQQAKESSPGAFTVGQITGGVGSAIGLGRAGLSLTGRLAGNAGLGAKVLAGAGEGAAYGGAYGLGSGEGVGDRLQQGAVNAGLGAVVGGAIPLVAQGVSSGYRAVMDSRAMDEAAKKAGVRPEVARMITETLGSDGSLGQAGMANMQRAGKEAMLADAGPNARSVLDTAVQRGGGGAVSARGAIDQRVSRGAQDLTAALDSSLGSPQGVEATREAIRTGSSAARRAAYEGPAGAYAQPINYADPRGQAIEQLVKARVPASAIRRANELMRVMGEESQQILAKVGDDGAVTFETLPDVRQLDYITRALNDVAESGEGAGAMGGVNALGRAYKDLSREIRTTLRDLVPEYGKALDTAADPIRRSQAVELGSKILSPSMARDEVVQAIRGMSAAEKDAVSQGIRSRIDDSVANVTRAIQDGNMEAREGVKALRDLSSRANREKLTTVIGDGKAKALFDELDRIATSFDLRASVAENSKTFARQAVSGRIDDITAPGAVGTLAQGKPLNAVQRVAQALTGQTPEKVVGRQNQIYSEIADFLTQPAGNAIPAFGAMQNYGAQSVANQLRALELQKLISGAQPLAYPISGQASNKIQR